MFYLISLIFILGLIVRLFIIVFQTHIYDVTNIIALFKSVADTGNLTDGFFVLKNKGVGEIQLYGKIFYQIGALWLKFLEKLKILNIDYIFDTKPYQAFYKYLDGFLQWNILNYQLISIKFFQFFFDFLTLFLLVKIFNFLRYPKKNLIFVFLFWSFYPLLFYTNYVLIQSDSLLLIGILGSLFFILKYIYDSKNIYLYFSLIFISLGAVVKQVTLLIFPFLLIILKRDFILYFKTIFIFLISYLIFSQFWSQDLFLIKKFLINSHESLRLFNFSLNGVSIFFLLYFLLIFYFSLKKEKILKNPKLIIYFYVLIFSIIYVSYDLSGLFVQFNLWIAPLLLFLVLENRFYSPFLFLPIIGFFKRILEDNDVILGSFGPTFGSPLHHTLNYQYFFSNFINPEIIFILIKSIFVLSYLILIYFLVNNIINKNREKIILTKLIPDFLFNLNYVIIFIFIIYNLFVFFDLNYRKNFSLLTKYNYEKDSSQLILKEKPFLIEIDNINNFSISGIDIKFSKVVINYNDPIIVEVRNFDSKILDKVNFSLYNINNFNQDLTFIKFNKPIKNKKFFIQIYNKNPMNIVYLDFYKIKSIGDDNSHYAGLDNFYKRKLIKINFKNSKIVYINLRGNYSYSLMIAQFIEYIKQKPKFYFLYFAFLMINLILAFYLFLKSNLLKFNKFLKK